LKHISVSADALTITDLTLADGVFKLREMAEQAQNAGAVTTSEAETWLQALKHADESGEFFAALTMFCLSGAK